MEAEKEVEEKDKTRIRTYTPGASGTTRSEKLRPPVLNPPNAAGGVSLHAWSSTVEGAVCVPFGCVSASWMRVEYLGGGQYVYAARRKAGEGEMG